MSRYARPKPVVSAPTPVWVWLVYAVGLLAAAILVLSFAFSAVVYLSSDDEESFGLNISVPALVLWVGLVAFAAGTLAWRRRKGRR